MTPDYSTAIATAQARIETLSSELVDLVLSDCSDATFGAIADVIALEQIRVRHLILAALVEELEDEDEDDDWYDCADAFDDEQDGLDEFDPFFDLDDDDPFFDE